MIKRGKITALAILLLFSAFGCRSDSSSERAGSSDKLTFNGPEESVESETSVFRGQVSSDDKSFFVPGNIPENSSPDGASPSLARGLQQTAFSLTGNLCGGGDDNCVQLIEPGHNLFGSIHFLDQTADVYQETIHTGGSEGWLTKNRRCGAITMGPQQILTAEHCLKWYIDGDQYGGLTGGLHPTDLDLSSTASPAVSAGIREPGSDGSVSQATNRNHIKRFRKIAAIFGHDMAFVYLERELNEHKSVPVCMGSDGLPLDVSQVPLTEDVYVTGFYQTGLGTFRPGYFKSRIAPGSLKKYAASSKYTSTFGTEFPTLGSGICLQKGDSGAGVFRKMSDGQFCLLGINVASASADDDSCAPSFHQAVAGWSDHRFNLTSANTKLYQVKTLAQIAAEASTPLHLPGDTPRLLANYYWTSTGHDHPTYGEKYYVSYPWAIFPTGCMNLMDGKVTPIFQDLWPGSDTKSCHTTYFTGNYTPPAAQKLTVSSAPYSIETTAPPSDPDPLPDQEPEPTQCLERGTAISGELTAADCCSGKTRKGKCT